MKILQATLSLALAAALVACTAPVLAGASGKAKYRERPSRQQIKQQPPHGSRPDYYEHIADKLPFGSRIWWEQMRREGRVFR
jgi:hypothetical protein